MSPNRPVASIPTQLRFRPNVEKLSADQLGALREAIGSMAQISDDRGFQYFARLHGGPPRPYCQHGYSDQSNRYHGAPLFLPWHRAYLHLFELAMQDRVGEVMLPWWDWTSAGSQASGIPAAYDGSGNPLASQPIARGFPRSSGVPADTSRDPGSPADLPTSALLETVLSRNSFMDFSTQLEQQLHNLVHGWVGGAMGAVPIAAFDPIFYAHHCMVDRVWRLWQLRHGQPGPPPGSHDLVLEPFPLKVGDVLDVHALGYDYAGATATAPGNN